MDFLVTGPMCKYAQDLTPMLKILAASNSHMLKLDEKLNAADIEEWIHIDDDIEVAATFTDQEIIESITTPEKIEENFQKNLLKKTTKFKKRYLGLLQKRALKHLQDVMHAHMVQNNLITKKLQSRKQGDIRKYLKKVVSSSAADAVEAASVPSTSSAADDIEVEINE
ncbi:Fatty-acid amide hydrolase 2-like, partial [Homarus americanus]